MVSHVANGLIGRTRELDDIQVRTRGARLVTVVGPGGVGKTALAHAAAELLADGFPMGVRHVDLTRVDDPAAVPGTIAAELGFDSFDALLASPVDQPALLVVDNCEHLLDATALALAQVLGACRQPTIVATSRSPLELPGESIISLAPLGLPTAGDDPLTSPSVELFLQRCRDAGVEVAGTDIDTVVELCRRLDGLPLAIEIAAARTRTMSISEIVARLDDSLDVLDRSRFAATLATAASPPRSTGRTTSSPRVLRGSSSSWASSSVRSPRAPLAPLRSIPMRSTPSSTISSMPRSSPSTPTAR